MFLRPYRPADKRILQQLFHDTVHTVNARDYSTEQAEAWAPALPDWEYWAKLDTQYCFVIENHKLIVGFASLSLLGSLDFLYAVSYTHLDVYKRQAYRPRWKRKREDLG